MSRILRFFALVAVVFFSVNAFAGEPYGSCSARKVYTDCAEGYVLQNDECVLESSGSCSAGQYWNGSACQSCPSTHPNSAAGASSESECFKTAELMKNGGNGTCFGKTGTLDGVFTCYYGSTCALPSWNASSCNMTNGSKIFKGWSSADNATTGGTGDFVHGQTYYAVWVIPSCNITNGSGTATTASSNKPRCNVTCDSGYGTSGTYTGSAGATSVSYTCTITSNTCSARQYWNGSACQECTSGYYCPGGTWTGTGVQGRESCPAGYGNSDPGSVDESDCYLTTTAGKYVATPESAETTCAENGYCPGGIEVSYGDTDGRMACTANSSSGAGSDDISDCKCNAGYGGNAGVTNGTCTICAAGKYKTSSGNTSCSTCTAGYYCTGGANRTACTANSSSGAGSDAISDCQCNAGYGGNAGVTNGTCTICAAGTYKTGSGNSSCSTCTEGYYCTGGTNNQTACPTGYGDSAPGSDAQSDCYMVVPAGSYLPTAGSTTPFKCAKGSSSGQHEVYYGSVSQCSSCAPGSYTPYDGAACSTCPAGSYCTGDGNATRCPALYPNSSAGSDAATDCYTNTLTGQYIATPRAEVVTDCQAGTSAGAHTVYYGETSQCNVCKANQWSGDAAGSCQACPSGWTNYGATAADHAYISSCKHTVGAGFWYNSDNSTFDICATGTYSAEHLAGYGVSTSCESCNTGYTNNTDHTACVAITSTISFNANGGTGGQTAPVTATYGSQMPTISTTKPTRTGYSFQGWYDAQTGGTRYYTAAGASARTWDKTADTTLYARWSANGYSIVLYHSSGTTTLYTWYDRGVYLDSYRSQAMTTSANPVTKPTRDGYTFGGYYSESGGTGTQYIDANGYITSDGLSAGKECTDSPDYCRWYAKWTGNTYTVSFNANGGTGGQTASVTATYGSPMPEISTTAPTRTGYAFNGWYDAETGGNQYYTANGTSARTWDKTANTTLYAQWTARTYTVSFDANGGTGGQTDDVTATYGSEMPPISTTAPTRTGYTFSGWYDAQTGGNRYYYSTGASARTWDKTANTTLYAHWTAKTYTCSSGQYLNVTSCATCTAGYYCPSSSATYTYNGSVQGRTPCGGGKYSSAGATSCSNISAGCYGTSASSSCPAVCAANTYSNAGASSCSSCPTGYKNSGDTAESHAGSASCIITVSGGYYIGTAGDNSSNWDKCAGGTYKASHTVAYGSTSSCTACGAGKYSAAGSTSCSNISAGCYGTSASSSCPAECAAGTYAPAGSASCSACTGRTKYSAAKAGSCSTVSGGYYTTGCNTSGNNCTGQSQCTSGTYCTGGEQKTCPSGYGASAAGSDAAADCYMSVAATKYVKTANDASATACGTGTYKAAHTVYYGGTSTCNSCPTGYDDGAAASAESGCKISVAGGKYVGTENSATLSTCSAGYYKAAHSVTYGSTSSCSACGAVNKYSSSGASSCSTVSSGYYTTGGTTTTRTGQSQCTSGTYCTGGEKKTCPSGYGASAAGSDAAADCYMSVAATKHVKTANDASATACGTGTYKEAHTVYYGGTSTCNSCPTGYDDGAAASAESGCKISVPGGKYVGTENSATLSTCSAGYYKAAHSVAYGSTSSCSACGAVNKYSSSGASSCSTVSSGYYTTGGTTTTRTGQSQCTSGYYCTGGEQKTCPSGYGASAAGSDAAADCYMSVAAAKHVAGANDASATACGTGTYKAAHTVYYGGTSTCNSCPSGYDDGAAASAESGCKISVPGGKYVGTENSATLSTCSAGYYKAAHSVAYGSTSSCSACGAVNKYSSSGASSCSTVSDGYYTTGGTTATRTGQSKCASGTYCTGGEQKTCPTGYDVSAAGSVAAADCYMSVAATKYVKTAKDASATACGTGTYKAAHTVYYGDTSTCNSCPTGYDDGAAVATQAECIISVAGGKYVGTENSATLSTCAGGTYKAAHSVAYGSTSSCETCGAGYYCPAGADSQRLCADLGGGLYSKSNAGSDATNDCYATVPATKYLSSSTSTSFTTCTAGYYCPGKTLYYASTGGRTGCGGGKYSEAGSDASSDCKTISAGCYGTSASSACPYTCPPGNYSTGGVSGCTICSNKPTNSSYTDAIGNTSADCPWTCDEGYNQTADNQCGQFCTAGITHIKSSNGLSVPLYSSARTSPAINVKVNDSICYGSLATGQSSGALNVRVGSTTYHSID